MGAKHSLRRLTRRQLRWWVLLFLAALAIPSAILVYKSFDHLKWQSIHDQRELARALAERIDRSILDLVEREEARPFSDYSFLNAAGGATSNLIQRSPLAEFPADASLPGLIGHFQINPDGAFESPLLPLDASVSREYGIDAGQEELRRQRIGDIQAILLANRLATAGRQQLESDFDDSRSEDAQADDSELSATIASAPVPTASVGVVAQENQAGSAAFTSQAEFDRLAEETVSRRKNDVREGELGIVEDLNLDRRIQSLEKSRARKEKKISAPSPARKAISKSRKEEGRLPSVQESLDKMVAPAREIRITTFESELDPFTFSRLSSGHFVLYRNVWRQDQRYIQGMLIDAREFVQTGVKRVFDQAPLSQNTDLVVANGNQVLEVIEANATGYTSRVSSASGLQGTLLYETSLSDPVDAMRLIFSVRELPQGPGASLLKWLAVLLAGILVAGCWWMYRVGLRQIALAEQQQDFVAAVSHELKTPLTSIRMYGEMLREGWVSDDKKMEYYEFINDESERLSRLINNVLQLSRLGRNQIEVSKQMMTVGEACDNIASKIQTQITRAGFELSIDVRERVASQTVQLDPDLFVQIIINLVDNAVKFSSKASVRKIDIRAIESGSGIMFSVRDYGPGIARDQMKKIFQLFYRSEDELTRETAGTGIGLALVSQLTAAMDGAIDVVNQEPGAEFRVTFPLLT